MVSHLFRFKRRFRHSNFQIPYQQAQTECILSEHEGTVNAILVPVSSARWIS